MIVRKGTLILIIVSVSLIAVVNEVDSLFFAETESVAEQTSEWKDRTNPRIGFGFLAPPVDGASIDAKAYPNPQRLTVTEWLQIKYPDMPYSLESPGGFVYSVVQKEIPLYVFSNGNAMIEMTMSGMSEQQQLQTLATRYITKADSSKTEDLASFISTYDGMAYRSSKIQDDVKVFNDVKVDTALGKLAKERGYVPRPALTTDKGLVVVDGFIVQPLVAEAWQELKDAAANDGIQLVLMSGYRSVDTQVDIFREEFAIESQKLLGLLPEGEAILTTGSRAVESVLDRVAVPGYSKHHSGWVIDITQLGVNTFAFGDSEAFKWISKNNYENARKHGFMPSYPEDGPSQGPKPEPWEYAFVGKRFLGY